MEGGDNNCRNKLQWESHCKKAVKCLCIWGGVCVRAPHQILSSIEITQASHFPLFLLPLLLCRTDWKLDCAFKS